MEKEFVIFELAMILKEKGFDEKCLAHFDEDGELNNYPHCIDMGYQNHEKNYGFRCAAPLWQQAFQWLMEKHDVCINFDYGSEFMLLWEVQRLHSRSIINLKGSETGIYFARRSALTEALKAI